MRILFLLFVFIMSCSISYAESKLRFGLGVNERYAGAGVEVEYLAWDKYSFSLAAGFIDDISGALGINRYFDSRGRYKYRVSAFYGRVASADCFGCRERDAEVFNGLSMGGGMKWDHFEFTLFYSDLSDYDDFADDVRARGGSADNFSEFGLSLGYQF